MKGGLFAMVVFSLILATLSAPTQVSNQRQKRVSDQRLAELETLLALAQMKNRKYMSLPVGFGLIDVHQIGRKKRSTVSPLSQFILSREMSEAPQKASALQLPFKVASLPLKQEFLAPYSSPVVVDALQGWDRRDEPNIALLQENGNFV